jgi:hypothetical protein
MLHICASRWCPDRVIDQLFWCPVVDQIIRQLFHQTCHKMELISGKVLHEVMSQDINCHVMTEAITCLIYMNFCIHRYQHNNLHDLYWISDFRRNKIFQTRISALSTKADAMLEVNGLNYEEI